MTPGDLTLLRMCADEMEPLERRTLLQLIYEFETLRFVASFGWERKFISPDGTQWTDTWSGGETIERVGQPLGCLQHVNISGKLDF